PRALLDGARPGRDSEERYGHTAGVEDRDLLDAVDVLVNLPRQRHVDHIAGDRQLERPADGERLGLERAGDERHTERGGRRDRDLPAEKDQRELTHDYAPTPP